MAPSRPLGNMSVQTPTPPSVTQNVSRHILHPHRHYQVCLCESDLNENSKWRRP